MVRFLLFIAGVITTLAMTPGALACELLTDGFGPRGSVSIRVETLATGLHVPWSIVFLSRDEFLVSERNGRVRLFRGGQLVARPVLTVDVEDRNEGGLLGIAVHPRIASNRFFYAMYSARKSGRKINRVSRFKLAADSLSAEFDRIIVDDIPAGQFHDGGRLRFGPDGMLYIGTGDGRVPDLSQDPTSLAGKILRVTDDGGVPNGNPIRGSLVFALGIRNMQAFDWLSNDTLIVADHGPTGELGRSGHDEVSILQPGANLGWPTAWRCEERSGFVEPIMVWSEAVPPGGLAYYTGDAIPEWRGSTLIATLKSRHLQRVEVERVNGRARVVRHEVYLAGTHGRLREVIQAPDGSLYVTTSNCDGRGTCGREKDKILRLTSR